MAEICTLFKEPIMWKYIFFEHQSNSFSSQPVRLLMGRNYTPVHLWYDHVVCMRVPMNTLQKILSVFSILPERLSGYQVPFIHDGKGPPSYDITRAQLELLVGSGFTSRQIAEILGVSQSTVRRRLRQGSANL